MPGRRVDRVVILPRYTAFIGGATALPPTEPMDIRRYSQVILTGWQGTGLGATPATVSFTVEQSADLEVWHAGTPFTPPAADSEVTQPVALYYPWMRVRAGVNGTDQGATCWLVGEFVHRESAVAGRVS